MLAVDNDEGDRTTFRINSAHFDFDVDKVQPSHHLQLLVDWTNINRQYAFLCFGNGRYFLIPIMWCLLYIVITAISSVSTFDTFSAIYPVIGSISLIEVIANAYFGYYLFQHDGLERIFETYRLQYLHRSSMSKVIELKARAIVNIITLVSLFTVMVLTSGHVFLLMEEESVVEAVFYVMDKVIYFCPSTYLCAIYCAEMYMILKSLPSKIFQYFDTQYEESGRKVEGVELVSMLKLAVVTGEDGVGSAECYLLWERFFSFAEELKHQSAKWSTNNLLRTLTGFASAGLFVYRGLIVMSFNPFIACLLFSFAVFYFLLIWMTAALTGAVNDAFFETVLRQLSRRRPSVSLSIQDITTLIEAVRHSTGLHFAGISVSKQKALSAGSLILSLIFLLVKSFGYDE